MLKGKRKHVAKSHKTLNELKSGETIRTYIPFEENTPDYFNGHHPDTIRPQPYRNRFGQAGKERLVVYIGKDSYNNMLYLPITSSHASRYDSIRHYEVKDRESIDKRNIYDHSYVETTSLRALPTTQTKQFKVEGKLSYEDYHNTMHRVIHTTMQFASEKDYRGVVPDDMLASWERDQLGSRYRKRTNNKGDTVYTCGNSVITRTEDGMVHYHKRYSKKIVRKIVEYRENTKLGIPRNNKDLTSFAEHVDNLSASQSSRRARPQTK